MYLGGKVRLIEARFRSPLKLSAAPNPAQHGGDQNKDEEHMRSWHEIVYRMDHRMDLRSAQTPGDIYA